MFARIKKNTNTNKRTVLVCHNVRFNNQVRQQTVKVFGHSRCESELQTLFADAKDWVNKHGSRWLEQFKKSKIKKRMRHKALSSS